MTTIFVFAISGLCRGKFLRFEEIVRLNPEFTKEDLQKNLKQLVVQKRLESSKEGDVISYKLAA